MDDFLLTLNIEGFTSRLKRLSDYLLYSTRDLYDELDIAIEPNWNLVIRLLQKNQQMTLMEIADQINFSHPAVVKIIKKMKKRGFVKTQPDQTDGRKQLLLLTPKALKQLPQLEQLWQTQIAVLTHLLKDSPNFLTELGHIEEQLKQQDYKQRVLTQLEQ